MMRRIVLCGLFLSVICVILSGGASASVGFDGIYDPSNWTITLTNSNGSVDTTGAPGLIQIMGSDNGSGTEGNTDYTIISPLDGVVSFDWQWSTANTKPTFDPFGYLHNGIFIKLTDDYGLKSQSGASSFSVSSGDVFGFRANSYDNILGASTTTISNFGAPVPVPTTILLFGSGLVIVRGLKKKYRSM